MHSILAFMGHPSLLSAGSPSHHQPLASKMLGAERCTTLYAIYLCESMTFNQQSSAAAGLACLSESENVQFACCVMHTKQDCIICHVKSCCRPARQVQSCAGLRLFPRDQRRLLTIASVLSLTLVVWIVSRLEMAKAKLMISLSISTSMQAILLSA